MSSNKSDINKEILEKIQESEKGENIKKFIIDALQFEYDNDSKSNPQFRETYRKLINENK